MLALVGAVREEIIDLKRSMVMREVFTWQGCLVYRGKYGNEDILLAQTGIGQQRAERAATFLLTRYPVTTIISIGFAGALRRGLRTGDIILCSALHCDNRLAHEPGRAKIYHSDAGLVSLLSAGPRSGAFRLYRGSSLTVAKVVTTPEKKQALGETFAADIVDMESYWMARIASARRVPFLGIRAIFDTASESLPAFTQMVDSDGEWHWSKAFVYFLYHPEELKTLPHLCRKAREARKSLTACTSYLISQLERSTVLR
jgi:adenosylhomocysteine nucleosidase